MIVANETTALISPSNNNNNNGDSNSGGMTSSNAVAAAAAAAAAAKDNGADRYNVVVNDYDDKENDMITSTGLCTLHNNDNDDGTEKGVGGKEEAKRDTKITIRKDDDEKIEKKKKKEIQLDYGSAFCLEQVIQMNMSKNELAWRFLSARQFWFFTVPQAILTMMSAIVAFMATSELFDNKTKVILNTIVGSASGIVVFLQTMSGVCNYGIRASMHESTALNLRNLRDDLSILKHKIAMEDRMKENNNDNNNNKNNNSRNKCDDDNDNDDDDDPATSNSNSSSCTFDDLRTRFSQCLIGCQSTIPLKISDAFNHIDSSLQLMLTGKNATVLRHKYSDAYPTHFPDDIIMDIFCFKAYQILVTNMVDSPYWPFLIPDSHPIVHATIDRLKLIVINADSFWGEHNEQKYSDNDNDSNV